jgi:dihydrofolate reductase
MSKVVVYMSMSLDGFVAADGDGPGRGLGVGGESLHGWLTAGNVDPTSFRPEGGTNAEVFDEMMGSGAVVTGRHTFEWAGDWGGDHHDGVPIFVLTRSKPAQPHRGLAHYVSDLASAVTQAKAAAGDKHVMVHGASAVHALHDLGLVDEYVVHLVPIALGGGKRLFTNSPSLYGLRLISAVEGVDVLHLRYAVSGR